MPTTAPIYPCFVTRKSKKCPCFVTNYPFNTLKNVVNRHIISELQKWSENPDRKPLILRGARQVGKTTLVDQFSKQYAFSINLNLERAGDLRYFENYDSATDVVQRYLLTGHLSDLARIYESIRESYKDDVEKYAKNTTEARVIRHIMNTAPAYLDKRVKFQNFGNSNYRSREVIEALDNLNDAYKGAIIPHLITQELISLSKYQYHKPNFWVREKTQSSAEVDLVLPVKDKTIPIEVKSGKAGKLRSLHQFIDRCDHPYAVRMYAGRFSIEQHKTPGTQKQYLLMNLPYYLGTKLPEYLKWFVENHSL